MNAVKIAAVLILYAIIAAGLFWAHNAWAALLAFHAWMLAILLLSRPGISIRKLLELHNRPLLLPAFALLGAGSGLVLYLFWPMVANTSALPNYLASLGLSAGALPPFVLYFALVNPWIEEYFWRGYLGSASRGIVLSDIAFAGYHLLVAYRAVSLSWLLAILLVLTLASWLWRQASRLSDGLLIAAISHLAADASILSVVCAMMLKG